MTTRLPGTELGDFAVRALERPGPNEWMVLVVPVGEVERAAGKLTEELSAIAEGTALRERVSSASTLIECTQAQPGGALVLTGLELLGVEQWQALDRERSVLKREGVTLLVLGEESLGLLMGHAPNLASWLGGAVWRLEKRDHVLSAEDREARLDALRRWAGLSDTEVISRAEQGRLSSDPPFAEWLVLLGRGDLIGE